MVSQAFGLPSAHRLVGVGIVHTDGESIRRGFTIHSHDRRGRTTAKLDRIRNRLVSAFSRSSVVC